MIMYAERQKLAVKIVLVQNSCRTIFQVYFTDNAIVDAMFFLMKSINQSINQ